MQLSMSTCGTERVRTEKGLEYFPLEGIRHCAEAGFRVIDFNFAHAPKLNRPFALDDWENWVARVRDTCLECGVTVGQTHGYWFWFSDITSPEHLAWSEEMVRRSVRATAMLGKDLWMVNHLRTVYDSEGYNSQKTWEYNYARCCELGELGRKYGVGIALENLFPLEGKIAYASCPEDLLELLHKLSDPVFGICWDFGHANMARLDHLSALEMVAPHLKVTHFHDNKSRGDDHFIPCFGNIPWKDIMPKLKRIGYTGNLNFEVQMFYQYLFPPLLQDGLRFMHSVGTEMLRLYEQA